MYECNLEDGINIELYKKVIHIIYEEHSKYTENWIENQESTYNLGKTCICDICDCDNKGIIKPDFKHYIDSYLMELMSLYFIILDRIDKECGINIKGRVKNEESVIFKVNKKARELDGKFPINKCLNDLIGFRIIDTHYSTNIEKLVFYLNDKIKNNNVRIRHLQRTNGSYNAYHVYFRGNNNYFFPAELQIWDKKNEIINLESHMIYKKEYTSWPQKYKNCFERSE